MIIETLSDYPGLQCDASVLNRWTFTAEGTEKSVQIYRFDSGRCLVREKSQTYYETLCRRKSLTVAFIAVLHYFGYEE